MESGDLFISLKNKHLTQGRRNDIVNASLTELAGAQRWGKVMLSSVLGFSAALLQVVGYLLYIRSFLKQSIRPNAASFLMFAYGTSFIFILELHNGATAAMLLLPSACAAMSIAIAALCLRRGATEPVDDVEKTTFAVDLGLTIGYAASLASYGLKPEFALAFLIAGNVTTLTAFFPLLRSTYRFPKREKPGPWLIWTLAYACLCGATIAATGRFSSSLLVYPLLNLLLHGALVGLSLRRSGPGQSFRSGPRWVWNRTSPIHGMGMFAGRLYGPGEVIWELRGRPVLGSHTESDANAVGFAPDLWIDPEPPFEFVNHSCNANAAFGRFGEFYALRTIEADEEITLDYSTTEADPAWKMECSCGAPNCRQQLYAIQIAFADSRFPPAASPAMQQVWRNRRVDHASPAFPQLAEAPAAVSAPVGAKLVQFPET